MNKRIFSVLLAIMLLLAISANNQTLAFATQSAFERNAQNSPDYFIN